MVSCTGEKNNLGVVNVSTPTAGEIFLGFLGGCG